MNNLIPCVRVMHLLITQKGKMSQRNLFTKVACVAVHRSKFR